MAGVMMLAKPNRLRTSAEFDRVFKATRPVHGKLLSVRAAEADRFRAGFVIGKAVSLQAVVRNRLRRRLREIVRSLDLDPVELVVSAKRPAAKAGSEELRDELETLLRKADVLR